MIAPEGTRKKVDDLRAGFFHIAKNTHSDIQMIHFDFEKHIITREEIASDIVVAMSEYQNVKKTVMTAFSKEKPYHPEQCHLIESGKVGKTSLISLKKSFLMYVPPFIVCMIMISVIVNFILY